MKTIKVSIKFYKDKRTTFPSLNSCYRPHFIVSGDTEMLGVKFLKSDLSEFNRYGDAVVKLLYDSGVDYSKLVKGVTFNIVEGVNVVGDGIVLD